MSRFYTISIDGGPTYTSLTAAGLPNPGALNIEMDVQSSVAHIVTGSSFLRVWGIPLTDVAQAKNLNPIAAGVYKKISVFAGMKKGLPLTVPSQGGLLFQGTIMQAFGNWKGTDQTLDFIIGPCAFTDDAPGNFVINWKKGTQLSNAIAATLTAALPSFKQKVNISPKLVFTEDVTGVYSTLHQFASFVYDTSKSILGAGYLGTSLTLSNNVISVFDGTGPAKNTTLLFTDLIGQATWIAVNQIQVQTVLRADISVGDMVTLPPGQIATTAASLSQFRQGSVFQGKFYVQEVRHVGNFRQASGEAWCSIFTLTAIPNGQAVN